MGKMAFRRNSGAKLIFFLVLLLGSYGGWVMLWAQQGSALQEVSVGRDACHHCGMVISDSRHAVSVLDRDKDGHAVTRHFDDVGCFKAFQMESGRETWEGVAHDFESGNAVSLSRVEFRKTRFSTPMGTGWVAFETK
jgi:hypothetical protein